MQGRGKIDNDDEPTVVPSDPEAITEVGPPVVTADDATQAGLAIFNSSEFGDIRTVMEYERLLFCAKDVAEALGYADSDQAVRAHCKAARTRPVDFTGQVRHVSFIPEYDVYRLVMRSKLPGAERFQDWVVDEVLPAIRKTGRFEIAPAVPQDMGEALQLAADLWRQNAAQAQQLQIQTQELAVKDEQLEAQQPAVEFYARFCDADGLCCIREMAKALGLRQNCLEVARVALCLRVFRTGGLSS